MPAQVGQNAQNIAIGHVVPAQAVLRIAALSTLQRWIPSGTNDPTYLRRQCRVLRRRRLGVLNAGTSRPKRTDIAIGHVVPAQAILRIATISTLQRWIPSGANDPTYLRRQCRVLRRRRLGVLNAGTSRPKRTDIAIGHVVPAQAILRIATISPLQRWIPSGTNDPTYLRRQCRVLRRRRLGVLNAGTSRPKRTEHRYWTCRACTSDSEDCRDIAVAEVDSLRSKQPDISPSAMSRAPKTTAWCPECRHKSAKLDMSCLHKRF